MLGQTESEGEGRAVESIAVEWDANVKVSHKRDDR